MMRRSLFLWAVALCVTWNVGAFAQERPTVVRLGIPADARAVDSMIIQTNGGCGCKAQLGFEPCAEKSGHACADRIISVPCPGGNCGSPAPCAPCAKSPPLCAAPACPPCEAKPRAYTNPRPVIVPNLCECKSPACAPCSAPVAPKACSTCAAAAPVAACTTCAPKACTTCSAPVAARCSTCAPKACTTCSAPVAAPCTTCAPKACECKTPCVATCAPKACECKSAPCTTGCAPACNSCNAPVAHTRSRPVLDCLRNLLSSGDRGHHAAPVSACNTCNTCGSTGPVSPVPQPEAAPAQPYMPRPVSHEVPVPTAAVPATLAPFSSYPAIRSDSR